MIKVYFKLTYLKIKNKICLEGVTEVMSLLVIYRSSRTPERSQSAHFWMAHFTAHMCSLSSVTVRAERHFLEPSGFQGAVVSSVDGSEQLARLYRFTCLALSLPSRPLYATEAFGFDHKSVEMSAGATRTEKGQHQLYRVNVS